MRTSELLTMFFTTPIEACFASGFLMDDKEYIAAIKEASVWGSGHFLRLLFFTLLIASSMHIPKHVWEKNMAIAK